MITTGIICNVILEIDKKTKEKKEEKRKREKE